jgi:hypothetical protein
MYPDLFHCIEVLVETVAYLEDLAEAALAKGL